jgi:CheY-like chemotaxis protein
LRTTPFKIETATNGQEAIDKFKMDSFLVVLMDIQMPVKDGYTAIQEIREWERQKQQVASSIIAVTANAMPEDRERCLSFGATDYLSKPVKKNDLLLMIEKYVNPAPSRAAGI